MKKLFGLKKKQELVTKCYENHEETRKRNKL